MLKKSWWTEKPYRAILITIALITSLALSFIYRKGVFWSRIFWLIVIIYIATNWYYKRKT